MKQYQWRSKTEFPIIKINGLEVSKGSKGSKDKILLQIEIENFAVKLHDLHNMPLFKILYLLKEALIAY